MAFFSKLVLIPALLVHWGPVRGQLPYIPSDDSINIALALFAIGYCAFLGGLMFGSRAAPTSWALLDFQPRRLLALVLVAAGLVGVYLRFGTWQRLLAYAQEFGGPRAATSVDVTTFADATATFLLPALAVGLVIIWCRTITAARANWRRAILSSVFGAGVVLSGSLFNYNRAAAVVPLVGLGAAYSRRVARLSFATVGFAAVVGMVVLLLVGSIRAQGRPTIDHDFGNIFALNPLDPSEQFQVYGEGPQFLAFMVDQKDSAVEAYPGETIISSILSPLPKLGKDFRPASGPAKYNQLLGRPIGTIDQIIPLDGELYWSGGVLGVCLGFAALGLAVARLHAAFLAAATSFGAYVAMYIGVWTAFLISGSIAVVSQIAIYFAWPFVFIAFLG